MKTLLAATALAGFLMVPLSGYAADDSAASGSTGSTSSPGGSGSGVTSNMPYAPGYGASSTAPGSKTEGASGTPQQAATGDDDVDSNTPPRPGSTGAKGTSSESGAARPGSGVDTPGGGISR